MTTNVDSSPVRILDFDGRVIDDASVPSLSDDELLEMYEEMCLARRFDERALSLSKQGRLGTYTPLAGQEAAQIGCVHAMDDADWFIPSYREHGAKIARGMLPKDILIYWMGNEEGNRIPEDLNIFTVSIPVGSQPPHATGMAWASKLMGEDKAFVCHFGDGATSQGDFHEGLNFAGVFDTPTVFVCNNNQWAISVPNERQTAAETFAQKAVAYGFEGVQVDGMDPLAVYSVTKEAVEKAKNPADGELRPTLIENVMYRLGPHTNVDDPTVYRSEEELERWKQRDPIHRMETYLRNTGILDDAKEESIQSRIEDVVADAVDAAESFEPSPGDMFDHVYESVPPRIVSQREYMRELRETYGDENLTED